MSSNDLIYQTPPGTKTSHFYCVDGGEEISYCQDVRFRGRFRSDKDALREGRIRLQLLRLRIDDSGQYLCHVKTDYGFDYGECELDVTAADPLQPVTPTPSPQPENLGKIIGYIFLAVLGVMLFVFFQSLRKGFVII